MLPTLTCLFSYYFKVEPSENDIRDWRESENQQHEQILYVK